MRCGCAQQWKRIGKEAILQNIQERIWAQLIRCNTLLTISCCINKNLDNLNTLCESFRAEEALGIMEQRGIGITRNNVYCILAQCCREKDVICGRRVQSLIMRSGLETITVLGDHLIRLFASLGSLIEANEAFNRVLQRSTYTWGATILAHADLGQADTALDLYHRMQLLGAISNPYVYAAVLKACIFALELDHARLIHEQINCTEFQSDTVVWNMLVDMYAKSRTLEEAQRVFNRMPHRDVVSWNAMIAGYVQDCKGSLALEFFYDMQDEGTRPSKVTFSIILKACWMIVHGRRIHEFIIQIGLEFDFFTSSALVDMYAKCGSLMEASKMFEKLSNRDLVLWNTMIAGYAQHGESNLALQCYENMRQQSIEPDRVTFFSILNIYGSDDRSGGGKVFENGLPFDADVGNIGMHNTGRLEASSSTLKSFASFRVIEWGRLIHEQIITSGFQLDSFVGSSLIDMYIKCGSVKEAFKVFEDLPNRDVVSWNLMLAGYAQFGKGLLVLECFDKLQQDGIKPSAATFVNVLKACGTTGAMDRCSHVHHQIIESEIDIDVFVGSALMDMYVKCRNLDAARDVFDKLPERDVVIWNTLIAGCTQHGENLLALDYFDSMRSKRVKPNAVTFLSILKACGNLGGLEKGVSIHEQIMRNGFESDVFIGSALVDMYAKCGNLEAACDIFNKLPNRDIILWNTMIAGYAQHGEGQQALECFDAMQQNNIKSDGTTLIGILNACSHAGLVDEGHRYFKFMAGWEIFHCNSMIDLLSRAGCFVEAEEVLKVVSDHNTTGWMTLLTACRMHGHVELGRRCFEKVAHL